MSEELTTLQEITSKINTTNNTKAELFSIVNIFSKIGLKIQEIITEKYHTLTTNIKNKNSTGDNQYEIDIESQNIIVNSFKNNKSISCIISEESETPIFINEQTGKYILTIDPLDGSSNFEVNGSMGTIFSIYPRKTKIGSRIENLDLLQQGKNQILAGYILYGPALMLIYSTNNKVEGYTYNPSVKSFLHSHRNIKIPNQALYYSVNESYIDSFNSYVQDKISQLRKKSMSSRYTGAFAADFHRILNKGGIYMYPATQSKPSGKLRLLYENNPLAYIAKNAGGMSTNGKKDILEILPKTLHDTSPLFIGSKNLGI